MTYDEIEAGLCDYLSLTIYTHINTNNKICSPICLICKNITLEQLKHIYLIVVIHITQNVFHLEKHKILNV
jgi:hypothetical protein